MGINNNKILKVNTKEWCREEGVDSRHSHQLCKISTIQEIVGNSHTYLTVGILRTHRQMRHNSITVWNWGGIGMIQSSWLRDLGCCLRKGSLALRNNIWALRKDWKGRMLNINTSLMIQCMRRIVTCSGVYRLK